MSAASTKSPDRTGFNQAAYSPPYSTDEPRKVATAFNTLPNPPTSEGLRAPAGGLLKGATEEDGRLKPAAVMVGIKLDLEAEVHLTARIRGDIVIGLY